MVDGPSPYDDGWLSHIELGLAELVKNAPARPAPLIFTGLSGGSDRSSTVDPWLAPKPTGSASSST